MTTTAVGINLVDLSNVPTGVWVSVQRLIEAWYGGWRWRDWRTHRCRRGRTWSKPGPWVEVPGLSHPRQ